MKWFDNPHYQQSFRSVAGQLVMSHKRIHHLELQLKKKNEKLARLHRKMKMSKLEYQFKSAMRIIKK